MKRVYTNIEGSVFQDFRDLSSAEASLLSYLISAVSSYDISEFESCSVSVLLSAADVAALKSLDESLNKKS